jgi:hypothetical protein
MPGEIKTENLKECAVSVRRGRNFFWGNWGKRKKMEREIKRSDVSEKWAHSGIVEAGDFVFIN